MTTSFPIEPSTMKPAALSGQYSKEDVQAYNDFLARRCAPLSTLILLAIAITCIDLPLTVWFVWNSNVVNAVVMMQSVLKGLACIVLAYHCARRYHQNSMHQLPIFKAYSLSHWLQLSFCWLYTASSIMHLFQDTFHPLKDDSHTISALSVMLTPLLLGVVFSDALRGVIILLWVAALLSLTTVAWLTASPAYAAIVVYYFLQSALIFYAMQQSALLAFLKAQVALKQEADALGAADSNMKAILGNVAHDLKTPLASFMAGVQVVRELVQEAKGRLTVSVAQDALTSALQCLQHVDTTNNFMLMTINRCLDYTKTSQGLKLVPRYETVPLLETMTMPLLCMKDIQQRVHLAMKPLPKNILNAIITDKQWLQENILCLLSNAVKYSAGGTVTVSVSLVADSTGSSVDDFDAPAVMPVNQRASKAAPSARALKVVPSLLDMVSVSTADGTSRSHHNRPQQIRIEVEDCGIGMSEEAMAALFSPFQQNQRLAGGTGLGLFSLAKRMEAMQGACGVSKRQDDQQGSLFWFSFPYRPDELHSELEGEQPAATGFISPVSVADEVTPLLPTSAAAEDEGKLHVLLVDDSPSVVKMTTMLLKRQGFAVSVAENGVVALNLLTAASSAARKYDVVLMDLQMPVMDGLEAVKRLRQHEASNALPRQLVFGLSANDDTDTQDAVQDCGFDEFLPKPYSHQTFLSLLQQHQV